MSREKPKLRGYAMQSYSRAFCFSLAAACATAVYLKYNLVEARKKEYRDFFSQYDVEKEYQAIKAAGIFKGFEDPR